MSCSILIDNHNNGPFLRACIDSVITQMSSEDEIIVYDDGSTDEGPAILRNYGDAITAILAPKTRAPYRQCQATALAEAFRRSKGDYIFLLDGDDVFLHGKLAAYVAAFEEDHDVAMVQSSMLHIDRQGEVIGQKLHRWAHGIDTREEVESTQDLDYFYPTSALALRRDVMEAEMPLQLDRFPSVSSDIALSIAAVIRGKVVTLDEPLTAWRQHRSNHSDRFAGLFHRLKFDLEIARYYNTLARRIGAKPKIHPWRNPKIYRRTARHITHDILKIG
jgi:glycosyltransferase involved in cell wall biosynthesis